MESMILTAFRITILAENEIRDFTEDFEIISIRRI